MKARKSKTPLPPGRGARGEGGLTRKELMYRLGGALVMRSRATVWIGIAVLTVATVALAAGDAPQAPPKYEWAPVYAGQDAVMEVDLARIRPVAKDVFRLWTRWFWAEPQRVEEGEFDLSVILSDFDCARNRVRRFVTVYKNAERKIIRVEELDPEDAEWTSYPPDRPGGMSVGLVCRLVREKLSGKERTE